MMYTRVGEVPPKRHTQFRQPDGSLYIEELIGRDGFSQDSALLYHQRSPTELLTIEDMGISEPHSNANHPLRPHLVVGADIVDLSSNAVTGRRTLFENNDVTIGIAPVGEASQLTRNGDGDELFFVLRGNATVESSFGAITAVPGDYVHIPKSTIHRWRPTRRAWTTGTGDAHAAADDVAHTDGADDDGADDDATDGQVRLTNGADARSGLARSNSEAAVLLTIESRGRVRAPGRYLSDRGQFLETSPFCERDIHPPTEPLVVEDAGPMAVATKRGGRYTNHIMASHPFDVVGWDGCLYPYKLNIHDFEPLTGRIHQPPPVHQTFESTGFVVCSFVPRKIDYHPLAIPAPYTHSNVDSDEVLVYFEGDFLSRRGVEIRNGSVTLHPAGMTHGPQPGAVEASLGSESTNEIAVMIDTFAPLRVAESVLEFGDKTYAESWTTRPTTEGPP